MGDTIGMFALVAGIFLLGRKVKDQLGNEHSARIPGAIVCLIGVLMILFSCISVVQAGNVGVVKLFGKVSDAPVTEGLNFINPFANVESVSVRTSEYTDDLRRTGRPGSRR